MGLGGGREVQFTRLVQSWPSCEYVPRRVRETRTGQKPTACNVEQRRSRRVWQEHSKSNTTSVRLKIDEHGASGLTTYGGFSWTMFYSKRAVCNPASSSTSCVEHQSQIQSLMIPLRDDHVAVEEETRQHEGRGS